jgi:hypothetical protein
MTTDSSHLLGVFPGLLRLLLEPRTEATRDDAEASTMSEHVA